MYLLLVKMPYENTIEWEFGNLEDIKKFIRGLDCWDDCTIIKNPAYVDVYELMRED